MSLPLITHDRLHGILKSMNVRKASGRMAFLLVFWGSVLSSWRLSSFSSTLFYRYYNGRCSRKFTSRIPPPLRRPRCTRGALLSHQFFVEEGNPRLTRCGASFLPATSVLWYSLPSSIFPPAFNLPLFNFGKWIKIKICKFNNINRIKIITILYDYLVMR